MRRPLTTAALTLLTGCFALGLGRHSVEGTSPLSLGETFAAATAELEEMGYSIAHADRRTGRIVATREPMATGAAGGALELRVRLFREDGGTHFDIRPSTRHPDAPAGARDAAGSVGARVTEGPRGVVSGDADALRRALLQRTGSGSRRP